MRRLFGIAAVGLLGCGGADPKPTTGTPAPAPAPGVPAAPAADPHEMDPAKHVVPATPAAGRLGGKAFTPDRVELQGGALTFRQGTDFFADLEVTLNLSLPPGKTAEGAKVTVRPAQKWHEADVSGLQTSVRADKDKLPDTQFVNDGYALTLELGKRDKGKVPGKIYLCLPDAPKSHLAGTFEATWVRPPTDPPGPDEAPFVQGTVAHPGAKDQMLTAGYVGWDGKGSVTDLAGTSVPEQGSGWVQSTTHKPRAATIKAEKGTARFDFVKLPPGRYLIYAKLKDGPSAWKWVDVAPAAQLTADLAIDPKAVGAVAVAGSVKAVQLTPVDPKGGTPDDAFAGTLGFALGYSAELKDGKATIPNVPPGTYRVVPTDGAFAELGTVEVTAGKTAAVTVAPPKK